MSILDLFCSVDAFWQRFEPQWQRALLVAGRRRRRRGRMSPSERMTILIRFQQAHYRTCTAVSTQQVQQYWREEVPRLSSYTRFVELMPSVLIPLPVYLQTPLGACTGVRFIDSTALAVCRTARSRQHRVFALDAARGKTAVGWFYGCQRQLVGNDRGEWLAFCRTRGTVDDRRPVPRLVRRRCGKLFGDRGYISQALAEEVLVRHGLHLSTKRRKHMRCRLLTMTDKLLLRKRALIATIYDPLKNICQLEHSRHRRPRNVLVNLLAGLIAYCHQPKKPSRDLGNHPLSLASLIPN